jgi:putative glutamine amidotransferase
MPRPLIGITAYDYYRSPMGWRYDVCYGRNAVAIEQAGGLPVLIPSNLTVESLREIYERLDGVLLPGGGDISPDRYNEEAQTKLYDVSENRDKTEISLMQWSVEDDVPIFGICRGIQVMNVAMQGSLVQDIPSSIETDLRHSIKVPDEPRSKILHDVHIVSDSRLASIIGQTQIRVNSIHHQSIKALAPALQATARADDGIIEGVEIPDKTFVLGVQWHPEDMVDDDARMVNLFKSFVEAAQRKLQSS